MQHYILKRLIHTIPLLIAISLTLFILIDALPGNELIAYINDLPEGTPRPNREQIEQMQSILQYNKPWHERYFTWVTNIIKGDFGMSLYYRRPARDIIGTLIWRTFMLNSIALLIIFSVAIPLGIHSAVMKHTLFDHLVSTLSLILLSIPSFFIGIYLMRLLAVNISWLPPTGMRSVHSIIKGYSSPLHEVVDILRHMIIPTLTLTLAGFGIVTRYIRNAVIDVINKDYIRTARSKGLSSRVILYRHAFRNTYIPIISLLGAMLPQLFIGNIFVEAIFAWPGIGLEFLYALNRRDSSVLSVILVVFSAATICANLWADIMYGLVDPRMKNRGLHE